MTKASPTVRLGFEVGTGMTVEIPIGHMCVTGMTQQAGKTTTLEALIERSGRHAITFITKRGEGSFARAHRIEPYFRERADWVFVSSLIDATLMEKNKLLRPWLMKTCRGTKTLREVYDNVREHKKDARGFAESIYTEIEGYLELVIPQLARVRFASNVALQPGVNAMDLTAFSSEVQALVIRSVIEWVNAHESQVITVIPEAWEFLPEGRGSPVKREAETLIRKGAGLKNFVWLDSQDLAGVWKLAVRACPIVLLGVQREANEIKRTLENIPGHVNKPSKDDLAQLELGQFYACWGKHVVKTYVQPLWLDEHEAHEIALGRQQVLTKQQEYASMEESPVTTQEADELRRENEQLRSRNADLERRLQRLEQRAREGKPILADQPPTRVPIPEEVFAESDGHSWSGFTTETDALYNQIKKRLIAEAPQILKVLATKPAIVVEITPRVVTIEGSSLKGRLARLIAKGGLETSREATDIRKELQLTGGEIHPSNMSKALAEFVLDGFLSKVGNSKYKRVEDVKISERDLTAR